MRILLFANNQLGLDVARYLADCEAEIVGLVLPSPERCRFGAEIAAAVGISSEAIVDGSSLDEEETLQRLADLRPGLGVSILFDSILRPSVLSLFEVGCINLHTSLLPHCRGANPNIWTIVEGVPAGVTLHWVDEGVDTGDIIGQRSVEVSSMDTGKTLYLKLQREALSLFESTWESVLSLGAPRTKQGLGGSSHRIRDLDALDRIDLDRSYTARELINILRARTFPPYDGAYFVDGDSKVFLRLELYSEGRSEPKGSMVGREASS